MSEHKERPILFTGPMVRAIMEGRKTQTRRVITHVAGIKEFLTIEQDVVDVQEMLNRRPVNALFLLPHCPYGVPGNRLWVREGWRIASLPPDENPAVQYRADDVVRWCDDPSDPDYGWDDCRYEAWWERMNAQLIEDCEKAGLKPNPGADMAFTWDWDAIPTRWRPSIHMPRWASRIMLEVTGVRVERVQDISHEDASAEGWPDDGSLNNYGTGSIAADWFAALWDSINANRGYGRDKNPWVWVVEFEHS